MPRHHRKSHRKAHRKVHRKSHKKAHRKSHRKTRRQHGGSCANIPKMHESFQQQRGGMASIAAGDAYLLDASARVQAEVGPLDRAFAELPSIPRQAGGYRRRRSHRRRSHRRQHGGMAPFASTGVYNPMSAKYAGENDQIFTEGSINPAFGIHGPQY